MDRPANRLLARLPDDDFDRLAPHLERVRIDVKQLLHHQGERIEQIYFPNGGVISIVTVLSNGVTVEGATIGVEGLVGIPAFFHDAPESPFESVVQVPDTDMMSLDLRVFRQELTRAGALQKGVERYAQVLMALMMQSNACNAVHAVHQRCARWLLMVRDHVGADEFQLSHEFLAQMLAVQRPTVSDVAGALRRKGLITYKHGRVHVANGGELEKVACECYDVMRKRFDELRR
jgi:CRP-like cAMP-binding protein